MPKLRVCVVGGSLGALPALRTLASSLPANFAAAVIVILHTATDGPGLLEEILRSSSILPVTTAIDGELMAAGRIYVAPLNRHLVLEGGTIRTRFGPRINFARPAIDPLFRSAAREYGAGAIGVILSGMLDDGTAGALAIQRAGGKVIVQNPEEAMAPEMPLSVLSHLRPDLILGVAQIGAALTEMLSSRDTGSSCASPRDAAERISEVISHDFDRQIEGQRKGLLVPFTCPECGGPLWQLDEEPLAFACHVRHQVTGSQLLQSQTESTERSIWMTMRLLKEVQLLARQLANDSVRLENHAAASQFDAKALLAARQLEHFEQMLLVAPEPGTR